MILAKKKQGAKKMPAASVRAGFDLSVKLDRAVRELEKQGIPFTTESYRLAVRILNV